METVQQLLNDANNCHGNIKLQANIGECVPFLDVLACNDRGVLNTSVYHKPSAEPYVSPFLSDHPRYTFANVIQTALIRAIRYSSPYGISNIERRAVELMLLYNDYPQTFIEKQFRKIFNGCISNTSILPIIGENEFVEKRKKLMGQPTARQSRIQAQITLSKEDDNDYRLELSMPGIASIEARPNPVNQSKDRLIIHYTHENRFATVKREIHTIFRQAFASLGIDPLRLIVGHRNSPTLQPELIREQPPFRLLKPKIASESGPKNT